MNIKYIWTLVIGFVVIIISSPVLLHIYGVWDVIQFIDDLAVGFLEKALGLTTASGAGVVGTVATKKVIAKKTFSVIVKNVGAKKVAGSVAWVIFKRHMIDEAMLYFKRHSFEKFKDNLFEVAKIKFEKFKESPRGSKVKGIVSVFGATGIVFILKDTFLGPLITALLQKSFYAVVTFFWLSFSFIFSFIFSFFLFVLQFFLILKILDYLEKFRIVKAFYSLVLFVFNGILKIIDYFFHSKLQTFVNRWSKKLDKYFQKIIDKDKNIIEKVQMSRDRYINGVEQISAKRHTKAIEDENKRKGITKFKVYSEKLKGFIFKKSNCYKKHREKRELKKQKLRAKRVSLYMMKKMKKRYCIKGRESKLILPDKENKSRS